jgi:hypothetical protein
MAWVLIAPNVGGIVTPETSNMAPFEWLTHKRHRRAALRDTERAIRRGQLDGANPAIVERRRALLGVVAGLIGDRSLSARELLRLGHLVAAMRERDVM